MCPELFEIPFLNLTIKSYGLMMVIGFIAAIFLIRRLSRNLGHNPDHITNAALYSLVSGIVGARAFYVIHYWDSFQGRFWSIFAVWEGGLELLGGVILAVSIIIFYMYTQKLPIRRYLDILAVALMLALLFGRIGCFLNGCCFGKPTCMFTKVTFPYNSPAFRSQVRPDPDRNRTEPYIKLPAEYFGYFHPETKAWIPADETNKYQPHMQLKPKELLTEQQLYEVTQGRYTTKPVHPTELYSSLNAFIIFLILYFYWKNGIRLERENRLPSWHHPGCVFGLMWMLYGPARFTIEYIRDDNPFEIARLTVSQLLGIGLFFFGLALMLIFAKMNPETKLHALRSADADRENKNRT